MTIITNITSRGANVTSSLAGNLTINEANGEIVIRNNSKEVVRIDKEGFKYYDGSAVKRISMGQDADGRQQIVVYGADGKAQIVVGQDPADNSPVVAVSEAGRDVLEDLKNG